MKKVGIIISGLIGLIWCFSTVCFGAPLLFVTDDSFPPYSYLEKGQIKGIDIEIVEEMAKRLNVEIRIEQVPWKRLLKMTQHGLCDGSFSLFKNKERLEYAMFATAQPIHVSAFPIFHKKDVEFKLDSLKDLYGKTIGVNRGFSVSESFDEAVRQGKIKVNVEDEVEENIYLTMDGQIDGFTNNRDVTLYKIKNNPRLKKFNDMIQYTQKSLSDQPNAYLVISKKAPNIKDKARMVQDINRVLTQMNQDGTFSEIFLRYINLTDFH